MIDNFLRYLEDELAYSPHTLLSYRKDLEDWRAFVAPQAVKFNPMDVTTNDTRAWVANMSANGKSTATIKRRLSAVRSLYNYMIRRHGATVNPATSIRINRRSKSLPKFIDRNEMSGVLDILDNEASVANDFESVRNDLIINMLYQTGMRASELTELTDERVLRQRNELKVLGKRNKERIIPYGETLATMIDRYLAIRPGEAGGQRPFFITEKGEPIKYNHLNAIVHHSLDGRVSSPKRSPHVLRHTFATDMLNCGADLTSVRKLLGHESLATTQIYTHVSVKELRDDYLKAHPRSKGS